MQMLAFLLILSLLSIIIIVVIKDTASVNTDYIF